MLAEPNHIWLLVGAWLQFLIDELLQCTRTGIPADAIPIQQLMSPKEIDPSGWPETTRPTGQHYTVAAILHSDTCSATFA